MHTSVKQRIKTQREILGHFAPEIDVEEFISNNPILKREAGGNLSGRKIVFVIVLVVVILVLLFFIRSN